MKNGQFDCCVKSISNANQNSKVSSFIVKLLQIALWLQRIYHLNYDFLMLRAAFIEALQLSALHVPDGISVSS